MPVIALDTDVGVAFHGAKYRISVVECAACGFEPEDLVTPPRCPKCHGVNTFRVVAVAGSALASLPHPSSLVPREGEGLYVRPSRARHRSPMSSGPLH